MTYTYHCSDCGNQVDEFCQDHPAATVESIHTTGETTRETITYRQISTLMSEALLAGDHEQSALCETVMAQERTYTGSTPADDAHTAAEHEALSSRTTCNAVRPTRPRSR